MRNPKLWVFMLTAASVVYALFAVWRAWIVFQEGNAVGVLLAIAIIVIPVLGVLMIIREITFGYTMQQMGSLLAREGGLLPDSLPKDPSGRTTLAAAEERFQELAATADLLSWRDWYLIGVAYDEARDRKAARRAMRTAEKLFRHPPAPNQ